MDSFPIRINSPVEAITTIRLDVQGLVRSNNRQIGYSGRYDKIQSALQHPDTINGLPHIAATTKGIILDYNDSEVLVKFYIGSAGHDNVALWVKRFQFGSCIKITGYPE